MSNDIVLGDCHTHLDQYPNAEIPEILDRARTSGVAFAICAGTTLKSTRDCIELAEKHKPLYAGVGIHPMEAHEPVTDEVYSKLEQMAKSSCKVVCISEVGLDFLPESPVHEIQYQVFREHIRLAKSLNLPVIFHSRDSHQEVFHILKEENADAVGGAMHYFQGDEATAREAIDCGFYISFARPLTRLPELQKVARVIPLDNVVLETDSAPQPFKKYRTNWTEPRHVHSVAETLAEIKGIAIQEVAEITTRNLARLVGLERLIDVN